MSTEINQNRETQELQEEAGRRYQMEHYLNETDQAAVEQLAERYKAVVPPERIEEFQKHPAMFYEDREMFDAITETETGQRPEPGTTILGYSVGPKEGPRIATDYLEVPKTIYHERLHQLQDSDGVRELGTPLTEGITEDLAIENLGAEPLQGEGQVYPEERAIAHQVRERCGDEAIERAYFQGDVRQLRACLNEALGPEGLEKLRRHMGTEETIEERV